MKCVHLFAVVFLSMFLVECIRAAPHGQGTNDLEPLFRDDAFVLNESNDEREDYKRFERYCKGERGSCWTTKDCCDDLGCLPPIGAFGGDGTCVKKSDYPNRRW
ncbi:uncharacterized protein LOC110049934 isoform X2 [Orbicella faveolata]|uniref:uncharacterized protein LOC110049934 isoform X1 n=1 Tax=Orbicella faveolata TaxID=48498 RepID=UPI0009E3ED24|nr:uncharacterized protein LOC110049934 isoform X1 [Orbicella faveolata]XP_020611443.1 uncharacterized protein LOC110049934 isoform X2 [Orbicella faveolata]